MAHYRNYKKKTGVDAKGRVALPSMRVYPQVFRALTSKAELRGLTPAYYILRLIAVDLGYVPHDIEPDEFKLWLRREPELATFPITSVAGQALLRVWDGADISTTEVARISGLSYQQAYRQLSRDKGIRKTDLGWNIRSVASG